MSKNKFLIYGFGKMGQVHKKYLDKNNIENFWFDPFKDGGEKDLKSALEKVDHVIISSPEKYHMECYNAVRQTFNNKILLEKAAVLDKKHLHILDDEKLMVGMVERHNPAVVCLLNNINKNSIKNIDFIRCSVSNTVTKGITIFDDVGIHDLDLFHFFDISNHVKNINFDNSSNNYHLSFSSDSAFFRFIWSGETFFKERKIIVRQTDATYIADLQEQICQKFYILNNKIIVESLFVEKSSSIENQLLYFLSKDVFDNELAKNSHNLFFNLRRET